MPRQARTISPTSIYHVILRGVNKQQVFEDDEDYIRFINVLRRQTQPDVDAQGQTFQPRCHVYAYCLMGNHVHLLLKEGSETIGDIMKRIASSYVYYYNHKYDRVGSVSGAVQEPACQRLLVFHHTAPLYTPESIEGDACR